MLGAPVLNSSEKGLVTTLDRLWWTFVAQWTNHLAAAGISGERMASRSPDMGCWCLRPAGHRLEETVLSPGATAELEQNHRSRSHHGI